MAIGRPKARPLEVEVYKKFARWDQKYIQNTANAFPELKKPPPGVGASGTGSVNWVGLNADPCKAKHDAKREDAERMLDPKKCEFMAKHKLMHAGASSVPSLSDTLTCKFRERKLPKYSASLHYLEQKQGMGALQVGQGAAPEANKGLPARPGKAGELPLEELLYSGISRDNEGRFAYLHNRHQMAPQHKSKTPVTASQVVGWQCYKGPGIFVGRKAKMCPPPVSMLFIA